MINTQNYYKEINHIGANKLTPTLLKSHEFVNKITQDGASWETYHDSDSIKRMIDAYLVKLNTFEAQQVKPPHETRTESKATKKHSVSKHEKPAKAKKEKPIKPKKEDTATGVEAIETEIKFIRRFVLMNGKSKTAEQILNFLNALQKAIIERRIRKTSPYADQIKTIQDKLVELYNDMDGSITITLKPETLQHMTVLAKSEKVLPSVNFMKRYVRLQGKTGIQDKVKKLLADIQKAIKNGIITKADKYADKVNAMSLGLNALLAKPKENKALDISEHELNGLMGILNGCGCGLSGIDEDEEMEAETPVKQLPEKSRVMNSVDFAKLQFNSIGFTGKWLDFMGDPAKPFTAMVFGRPKMGKSYLCMEFAGYLARHFGKVLYMAKEEKLDATLQKKLNDLHVQHPNLSMSDGMLTDLSAYDFVFIDSVNKMELEPNDLETLKADNPGVSFIYVFQSTKNGAFRGSQHFMHDVDIVIEIPEKGLAIQNGRFNQGGEMNIFESK